MKCVCDPPLDVNAIAMFTFYYWMPLEDNYVETFLLHNLLQQQNQNMHMLLMMLMLVLFTFWFIVSWDEIVTSTTLLVWWCEHKFVHSSPLARGGSWYIRLLSEVMSGQDCYRWSSRTQGVVNRFVKFLHPWNVHVGGMFLEVKNFKNLNPKVVLHPNFFFSNVINF